jgi:hypothetical protein
MLVSIALIIGGGVWLSQKQLYGLILLIPGIGGVIVSFYFFNDIKP